MSRRWLRACQLGACSLLRFLLLAAVAVTMTGCGPDHSPYFDESLSIRQAMVGRLKTIEDAQTASKALPELKKLQKKYADWEQRTKDVPFSKRDFQKHKARLDVTAAAIRSELARIQHVLKDDEKQFQEISAACQGPLRE